MPYPGVSNPAVLEMVRDHESHQAHPQPPNCSDVVYAALLRCWARDPVLRPDFVALAGEFVLLRNSLIPRSHPTRADERADEPGCGVQNTPGYTSVPTAAVVQVSRQPSNLYPQLAEMNLDAHAMAEAISAADEAQRCLSQPPRAHSTTPSEVAVRTANAAVKKIFAAAPQEMQGPPSVNFLRENPYGTAIENKSPYGTAIAASTPSLQVRRDIRANVDTPGMLGFTEEIYAAAPEEMLGWTKPRDVISIYEDVGRPNLMPNTGGHVYGRRTPTGINKPSDGVDGSEATTPYAQSVSVQSAVGRELRARAWQEPGVLSGDTQLPHARRDTSAAVAVGADLNGAGNTDASAQPTTPATPVTQANDAVLLDAASATAELASVTAHWQHSSEC